MSVHLDAALNPALKRVVETSQQNGPIFSYLLTPVALVGYVLGFWRLGADLNWVGEFFVRRGLFSHWQVWIALAIITQVGAAHLNRNSRTDQPTGV
jgi:hypothetical protein